MDKKHVIEKVNNSFQDTMMSVLGIEITDFGDNYISGKMPVEGWACCNRKINDGILYILPYHNKAALVGRKELKAGFDNNKFQMSNRKYAKNRGWTTVSVPISWDRLLKVCPHTILFNYESN